MNKARVKALINRARLRGNACRVASFDKIDVLSTVSSSILREGVMVSRHASVTNTEVGRYTSIGRNTKITHARIGAFCAISWDSTINAISHPIERLTISAFPYVPHVGGFVDRRAQTYREVWIGNDVWIGSHVVIMPGVTIGDGAIIGAGSIVTKNVAEYEVVVGSPAKHLRWRFDTEVRTLLSQLRWWDWSEEKIRANIQLFQRAVDSELLRSLREMTPC